MSKLRFVLLSMAATLVLTGLLPGCTGYDNPTITPVPNLKEVEGKADIGPAIQKGMPKNYGQGKAYKKAFDKPDPN
jgi:hypothetical protein